MNKDTDKCNKHCYPFVMLHGTGGNAGFWGALNVPNRYKECLIENLPIGGDNPNVLAVVNKYIGNIDHYVNEKNI